MLSIHLPCYISCLTRQSINQSIHINLSAGAQNITGAYIIMLVLVHKRMSILTFEGLFTTFKGSTNVSCNKNLLIFVTIGDNTSTAVCPKSTIKVMRNAYNSFVKLTIVNSLLI